MSREYNISVKDLKHNKTYELEGDVNTNSVFIMSPVTNFVTTGIENHVQKITDNCLVTIHSTSEFKDSLFREVNSIADFNERNDLPQEGNSSDYGRESDATRRDTFALAALQGLLAGGMNVYESINAAQSAVQFADALMEELKEKK